MRPRAIVDVGSNSVRCFLPDHVPPIRTATVVGLRRGAAGDGSLTADALGRFEGCLAEIADVVTGVAPANRIVFATSAVRDAPNKDAASALVRDYLGTELRVLSGQTEAQLAFEGAYAGIGGTDNCTVIDPGGGSTELVAGGPDGVIAAVSLQLGAVRDTDRFGLGDPPTASALEGLRSHARNLLTQGVKTVSGGRNHAIAVIGVAGTITTLAAIKQRRYDADRIHGTRLTVSDVAMIAGDLARLTIAQRSRIPGLHPDRAFVILAGAIIVEEALAALGADHLVVSERDILDGVAANPTVVFGQ